jgi:hypothetical protein
MDARHLADRDSLWVKQATDLLYRLYDARNAAARVLANDDHNGRSDYHANSEARLTRTLLEFDCTLLVPLKELDYVCKHADPFSIESSNITYNEMFEVYEQARQLQREICFFNGQASGSRAAAKRLFVRMISSGLFIPEIASTIRVLAAEHTNSGLENEPAFMLHAIRGQARPELASSLEQGEGDETFELQSLNIEIDNFLVKPVLRSEDLERLLDLWEKAKLYHGGVNNFSKLDDVKRGVDWVEDLSTRLDCPGRNLKQLSESVNEKLANLSLEEISHYKDWLAGCLSIVYSVEPITLPLQTAKALFWELDARKTLGNDALSKDKLKNMIKGIPQHTLEKPLTLSIVKKLLDRVEAFESKFAGLRALVDHLICQDFETEKPDIRDAQIKFDTIQGMFEDNDLKKFKEFGVLQAEFKVLDKVFTVFKMMFRLKAIEDKKAEKISIDEFIKLYEETKGEQFKIFSNSLLFVRFSEFYSTIDQSINQLKLFQDRINKVSPSTIPLFDPKYLDHLRNFGKAEILMNNLTKLERYFFIGELGYTTKSFLKKFKAEEANLLQIAETYGPKLLISDLNTIKQVKDEYMRTRLELPLRVYTQSLEKLGVFEWALKAVELLRTPKAKLEDLRKHKKRLVDLEEPDMLIAKEMDDTIQRSDALRKELEESLKGDAKQLSDLKEMLGRLDQSPVELQSVRRKVNLKIRQFQWIDELFRDIIQRREEKKPIQMEELKALQAEVRDAQYSNPEILDKLRFFVEICESQRQYILNLIETCNLKVDKDINPLLNDYKETGFVIREVESLIKKRAEASQKLGLIRVEHINDMSMKQLGDVENLLRDSLDIEKNEQLFFLVLYKRLKAAVQLVEDKKDYFSADCIIKKEDYFSLLDRMGYLADNIEDYPFKMSEINSLTGLKDQVSKQVTTFKSRLEAGESLQLFGKSIFRFLDYNADLKKVAEEVLRQRRAGKLPAKAEPPKPAVTNVEINDELMLKNLFKEKRRESQRIFKGVIEEALQLKESHLASEYAQDIDEAIHSRARFSKKEFDSISLLYKNFIDVFKSSPHLCQLVIQSNYEPKLLERMIVLKKADSYTIEDEVKARKFIFQMEIELECCLNKEQNLNLSLGKRAKQVTINEYMNKHFRINQDCFVTPIKSIGMVSELDSKFRSGGNSDQKVNSTSQRGASSKAKKTQATLIREIEDNIHEFENEQARDIAASKRKLRKKVKIEEETESSNQSRASEDSPSRQKGQQEETYFNSPSNPHFIAPQESSKKRGSKEKVLERHVVEPPEDLKHILTEYIDYIIRSEQPIKIEESAPIISRDRRMIMLQETVGLPDFRIAFNRIDSPEEKHLKARLSPAKLEPELGQTGEVLQTVVVSSVVNDAPQAKSRQVKNSRSAKGKTAKLLDKDDHIGDDSHPHWGESSMMEELTEQAPPQCQIDTDREQQSVPSNHGKKISEEVQEYLNSHPNSNANPSAKFGGMDHDIVVPTVNRPYTRQSSNLKSTGHEQEDMANVIIKSVDTGNGLPEQIQVLEDKPQQSSNEKESPVKQKAKPKGRHAAKKKKKASQKIIAGKKQKIKNEEEFNSKLEADAHQDRAEPKESEEKRKEKEQKDTLSKQNLVDSTEKLNLKKNCDPIDVKMELSKKKESTKGSGLFSNSRSPPRTATRKHNLHDPPSNIQQAPFTRLKRLSASDLKPSDLGKRQPFIEQKSVLGKANSAFKSVKEKLVPNSKVNTSLGQLSPPNTRGKHEFSKRLVFEYTHLRRTRHRDYGKSSNNQGKLTQPLRKKEMLPALLQKKQPQVQKTDLNISDSKNSDHNKGSKRLKTPQEVEFKPTEVEHKHQGSTKKSTKDKSGSPSGDIMVNDSQKIKLEEKSGASEHPQPMQDELEPVLRQPKVERVVSQIVPPIREQQSMLSKEPLSKSKLPISAAHQLNGSFLPRNMVHGADSASSLTEILSDVDREESDTQMTFEDFKQLRQKLKFEKSRKKKMTKKSLKLNKIELDKKEKGVLQPPEEKEIFKGRAGTPRVERKKSYTQQLLIRNQIPPTSCWSIYEDVIKFSVLNDREAFLKLVALTPPQVIRKVADFGAEKLDINRIFGNEEFEELLMALSLPIASNGILKIGGFVHSEGGVNILTDLIRHSPGGSGRVFWSTIKESMEIYLIRPKDISPRMLPFFDRMDSEEMKNASFCFLMLQDAELYQDCRRMRPVPFEIDYPEETSNIIKTTFRSENELIGEPNLRNEMTDRKMDENYPYNRQRETNDLLNFDNIGRKGSINDGDDFQLERILEKGIQRNKYKYAQGRKESSKTNRRASTSQDQGDRQSCCSSLVDFEH